jgi:hypothetical protein
VARRTGLAHARRLFLRGVFFGLTRSKNAIKVAQENASDFLNASLF